MSGTSPGSEKRMDGSHSVTHIIDAESLNSPAIHRVSVALAGLTIAVCAFFLGYAVHGRSAQQEPAIPEVPPVSTLGN